VGVLLRGKEVPVDIETELSLYTWNREKWTGDKLIACSPFRDEGNPSFACNLESGVWIDSGSVSDEWGKGNFIKLMAYLRNETYDEAEEYILETYSSDYADVENLKLGLKLKLRPEIKTFLPMELLQPFAYSHPYLERRGLSAKTQRAVQIGYDPATRSIVIPWVDYKGRLVNWKHRSVKDKIFWYAEHGQRIKNHLYGLWLVVKLKRFDEVFVVESEIDALTLWQNGKSAVAMGGSSLTEEQRRLVLMTGIKRIVIATDNDAAGEKAKQSIIKKLAGFVDLAEIIFPKNRKDINNFSTEELADIKVKPVGFGFLKM